MMTVLEQRIAPGLRAVDEQTAIETVLFLDNPIATAVPADQNNRGRAAVRGRLDELHAGFLPEMRDAYSISSRRNMNSRPARRQSHRGCIGSSNKGPSAGQAEQRA